MSELPKVKIIDKKDEHVMSINGVEFPPLCSYFIQREVDELSMVTVTFPASIVDLDYVDRGNP